MLFEEETAMRENRLLRGTAIALAAMLAIGQTAVFGAEEDSVEETPDVNVTADASVSDTTEGGAPEKHETVYVMADASGAAQKVVVSDWLKNPAGEDSIEDETTLSGIENVKGDEAFSKDENGTVTWDAKGHDIFYQGTTDRELPVDISVKYTLDGEEVTPEEIAGKSGEVTVRYTYENNAVQETEIEGEKYQLHVPFAAVTGILLDENSLSDVHVTNGILVDDGNRLAVVGIAMPGLQEDLETPAYESVTKLMKTELPDYLEITAQAENFRMNTSYTIVTDELFAGSETDLNSMIEDVFGKLDSLEGGIDKLVSGVSSLNDGAGELKDGASDLSKGLTELTDQNETLVNGGKQILESMLAEVSGSLAEAGIETEALTIDNYDEVLDGVMEMLGVSQEAGEAADAADIEDSQAAQTASADADSPAGRIAAAKAQLDACREFYEGLAAYTEGVASAKEGADQVREGAVSLESGAAKLMLGSKLLKAALPDLSGAEEALRATAELAEEYTSFAGKADGMKGKVRFVWKTEGIG